MADRIVVDVDGTGYRSLTKTERVVLEIALENYRKCKAAEKMLKIQRKENQPNKETIQRQYAILNSVIVSLQEMVP